MLIHLCLLYVEFKLVFKCKNNRKKFVSYNFLSVSYSSFSFSPSFICSSKIINIISYVFFLILLKGG